QLAQIRSVHPIFEKLESIKQQTNSNFSNLTPEMTGIQINKLGYAYGEKDVLTNINYEFSLGNKYAIVGSSGSGKSTLLNILIGKLMDYTGSATFSGVELNKINGKDLRE